METILTSAEVAKILTNFIKKFPDRLLFRMQIPGSSYVTFDPVVAVKRDSYYKEVSIYLKSGLILSLSGNFESLVIADYYHTYYPILRQSQNKDKLEYQLRINLAIAEKGAYLPLDTGLNLQHSKIEPHHMILCDEYFYQSTQDTSLECLSIFFQGSRLIGNIMVYPDGGIEEVDIDDLTGIVATLVSF